MSSCICSDNTCDINCATNNCQTGVCSLKQAGDQKETNSQQYHMPKAKPSERG